MAATVHLIDASPYLFRAFFSLPHLEAPDGRPINAVRGFAQFLLRYAKEERPTHVAVCFDRSLTTSFRNDLYPGYKAGRELPPRDLEVQQLDCARVAAALGMATFSDERYEADDLIATLLAPLAAAGHPAVVVSPDKDLGQLVTDTVELFDFAKGVRYGPAEIEAKLGVRPAQVPDFLGLAGDSVDDIPGVRGVGAKTAAALLAAFDDLDALYADLDAVAELPIRGARSLAKKLEADRETAFLSRTLATLSLDAPAAATLEGLAWPGVDADAADPVFAELGIASLLNAVRA